MNEGINSFTVTKEANDRLRALPECAGYVAFVEVKADKLRKEARMSACFVAPTGELLSREVAYQTSTYLLDRKAVDSFVSSLVANIHEELGL